MHGKHTRKHLLKRLEHIKNRKFTQSEPSASDKGVVSVNSSKPLPWKFLFTNHDNRLHDVRSDSEFHIGHIIKHPHKFNLSDNEIKEIITKTKEYKDFGLPNTDSMLHALHTEDLDVAPNVQSVAMKRGMVRGYMTDTPDDFSMEADHTNPDHLKTLIHHIMPRLEHHAKLGNDISIYTNSGSLNGIDAIKEFAGAPAKKKKRVLEPKTQASPSGMGMPEKTRTELKRTFRTKANMNDYESQKAIEKLSGVWGDSVEPKSETKTFKELMETIRKVGSKWRVESKSGKNLGTFSTRSEATKRIGEVEWFKKNK